MNNNSDMQVQMLNYKVIEIAFILPLFISTLCNNYLMNANEMIQNKTKMCAS